MSDILREKKNAGPALRAFAEAKDVERAPHSWEKKLSLP